MKIAIPSDVRRNARALFALLWSLESNSQNPSPSIRGLYAPYYWQRIFKCSTCGAGEGKCQDVMCRRSRLTNRYRLYKWYDGPPTRFPHFLDRVEQPW